MQTTQPHSQRKQQIVGAWLPQFCAALSRQVTVWIVDGWADAASYGSGRQQVPGASVAIAEQAAARSPLVRCLLLAANATHQAELTTIVRPINPDTVVLHGDIEERWDAVMQHIGDGAALLVLDGPTAHTLPIAGVLERAARRLPRTEMLAHYDRAAVAELLVQRERVQSSHALDIHLDRVFGSRQWRSIVVEASGSAERDRQLRDLYVHMLVELGGSRFKWAAACPVPTTWGVYQYDLVFATPERNAGLRMNDLLYDSIHQFHDTPQGHLAQRTAGRITQIGLFDAAPPDALELQSTKVTALMESLHIICATQPRLWSYGDLCDHVLRGYDWFGRCSLNHVQAAVAALIDSGQISRFRPGDDWGDGTLLRLHPPAAEGSATAD